MNLVQALKQKGLTVSTAESFTGGQIASAIISHSGASEVFYEGIVCYNTRSKITRLGVKEQTVQAFGVVSSQVATEMVQGLLNTKNCDIAIATTGYADNTADSGQVGLCYIAVGDKKTIIVEENVYSGTREQVTSWATARALEILINFINERK